MAKRKNNNLNRLVILMIFVFLSLVVFAGYFVFFSPQSRAFSQKCIERKVCLNNRDCGEDGQCIKARITTAVGLCRCQSQPTEKQILWWFDDKNTICQQREVVVGSAYMYKGLRTFATKQECEKALKRPPLKNNHN
jgi:hypothetical protein